MQQQLKCSRCPRWLWVRFQCSSSSSSPSASPPADLSECNKHSSIPGPYIKDQMRRGSTVALAAAAAVLLVSLPMLLVSLPMLLVSLPAADTYEQENRVPTLAGVRSQLTGEETHDQSRTQINLSLPAADTYEQENRRMFEEWKAKNRMTYKYAGEEECWYAVFKNTRRHVAWSRGAGITTSGLNGLSATASAEIYLGIRGRGVPKPEEARPVFVGWKARYGKTYRDVGEEECRFRLFMGNRDVVVALNAASGQNVYGLNQFGDLTDEEVQQRCYPEMEDRELSARCQATVACPASHDPVDYRIRYQVCRCIATELKQMESGWSVIPGDEAHK